MNPESNLKEKDLLKTGKKNNNVTNLCMKQYLNIKKNIMSLFLENEDLISNNKRKKRHSSQPKPKYRRLNLKRKFTHKLFDKKISQKNNNKDLLNDINNEKIKDKNNESPKDINGNSFMNEIEENKIKNNQNNNANKINKNKNVLNKVGYSSNDINNYFSNDISSFKMNDNSNINPIENNSDINLHHLNNDGNFSDKSSKNSSKNFKINNLSSSSFSKNFILKSEICKSAVHKDIFNHHNKNNRSESNPIINYFSQDFNKNEKNIQNFYLSTAKNSMEEIDQNNYINFFPINEDSTKNLKNIMSCNYKDNDQILEEFYPGFSSGEEKGSRFAEFQNRENDENYYTLELIKKKVMKFKNEENKDNKEKNNIEEKKDEAQSINNNISNPENEIMRTEIKTANLVKSSLKSLTTNTNNYMNENNESENNNMNLNLKNNSQIPLSFVNNIYYINNSNYEQFQINPIFNNANQNSYYGPNTSQNQYQNYYNNNYMAGNYYNFMNNQNQNDYFKSLMNTNTYDNYNLRMANNSINNNYAAQNVNINNMNNIQEKQNININNTSNANSNINNQNNPNNSNNLKNLQEYSDEEILNLSVQLIKEQVGCRYMQEKIKSDHNFANELLFPKIKNNLKELSCDSFGNYFLQALIEILTFDNINKLFDITQKDFTDICISPHGTRVVQKLIEKISSTPILINKFIYNLNNKDLDVIFKSPYGNHVIQKFLMSNILEYANFIFNYVYKNFMDIAQTKHGVCIIQKCVSEGDENHREKIYKLILMNFNNLLKDQFGNYLIQYILINTKTEEKLKEILPILKKIEESMLDLCKSKYSANVIEKCFENGDNISREHLIKALINLNSDKIIQILLDNFGIYVIQKALKYPNANYRNKIIELILAKSNELSNINFNDYNYKIIQKVINSNKDLSEIFSKLKNVNINIDDNHQEKEDKMNKYYSYNNNYNNKGKNKKGKKFYKGYNNNF